MASMKPKKGESMTNFISHLRNLNIKCDRTLTEDKSVNLILKNNDEYIGMLLGVIKF
jgi:small nuclear ribonucleoprotein (snRNP)-like protein